MYQKLIWANHIWLPGIISFTANINELKIHKYSFIFSNPPNMKEIVKKKS